MNGVVHILSLGVPLCRFSRDEPRFWPEGHQWVMLAEKEEATCADCLEITSGRWLPVETWQELHVANATLYMERRPYYCDRGRFVVKVAACWRTPSSRGPIEVDDADGFPRYYFSEERAKAEIADWLAAKGVVLPGAPPQWRLKVNR